jgi:2'-5' RNA ligase
MQSPVRSRGESLALETGRRGMQMESVPWAPGQGPRAAERALTPEVPELPAAGEPGIPSPTGSSPVGAPSAPIPVTPRAPEPSPVWDAVDQAIAQTPTPPADQGPPIVLPPVAVRPGGTAGAPVAPSPELPPVVPSAETSPVWQAVDEAIAQPTDTSGRELGGYAGPERRTENRVSTPEEDARYTRMREKLAAGEPTGTEESRQVLAEKQRVEDYREQAAIDEVKAMEPKPDRDFSSTQIELPQEHADALRALAAKIPDEHLAEDGREDHPHVTVKFGLHTNDAEDVRKVLADEPPIKVRLGKTSLFPAKEGADYDVVKADVDSPDLHRLNAKIAAALEHTDTHPEYKPHATLAYVKPGLGKQYEGDASLQGREATISAITFSGKDRTETTIPLSGKAKAETSAELSDQDRSYQEWRENAGRVAANPEAASDKDLRRALGYLSHKRVSLRHNAEKNGLPIPASLIDSVVAEEQYYTRLLSERNKPSAPPDVWKAVDEAIAPTPPQQAAPVGKFADLSKHEQRELRRIHQELESYGYEGRTRTVVSGGAKGKEEIWTAGHGGAPVFGDIQDGRSGKRADVQRALANYIKGGKPSKVAERAVEIARRRMAGDVHLSPAILPIEAGESGVPPDAGAEAIRARSNARVADKSDLEFLVRRYDEHREFGNVVSRDNAKDLLHGGSREARTLHNDAVSDAAGVIADAVLKKRLAEPHGSEARVVLTSGGTGSGKTTVGTKSEEAKLADITYDSQATDLKAAKARIEQVLASGRDAARVYVYRDPVDAWINGVLPRADESGRPVSIEGHLASHRDALKTAIALSEQYADNPRVSLKVVDNTGEHANPVPSPVQFLKDRLEAYNEPDVRRTLRDVTDSVREELGPALYEALTGGVQPEAGRGRGEGAEGRSRGAQEQSPQATPQSKDDRGAEQAQSVSVLDTLNTGEKQARLPGAESARQAGKASTSFKAPQQASGEDFALGPIETPEATARREAAEKPGLFGEEAPSAADRPYSKAAIKDAFNLTPAQAEATDALVKAMGLDTDRIRVTKGGTAGSEALRQETAPVFFSALTRAAEALPQAKGTPEQMLAMLTKAKGVKQEELAWSGVKDWLSSQSGSITKASIVDYLRANELHVSEVALGAEHPDLLKKRGAQIALTDEIEQARAKAFGPGTQGNEPGLIPPQAIQNIARWAARTAMDNESVATSARSEIDRLGLKPEIRDAILHYGRLAHRSHILNEETLKLRKPTKFEKWQVPGGENYRELLITLPVKNLSAVPMHEAGAKYSEAEEDLRVFREAHPSVEEEEGLRNPEYRRLIQSRNDASAAFTKARESLAGKRFKGGHFDEPNVVAHVRFNDRVGQDGAKVLFVEEVQSDWHQKGRRHGYQSGERLIDGHDHDWWTEEAARRFNKRGGGKDAKLFRVGDKDLSWEDMRVRVADRAMELGATYDTAYSWAGSLAHSLTVRQTPLDEAVKAFEPDVADYFRILDEEDPPRATKARRDATAFVAAVKELKPVSIEQEVENAWRQAVTNRDALAGKPDEVPDAPFKTTWPELALKRIIRYAAENGYDRVAWTPGDVQSDRYDLSKRVTIEYAAKSENRYWLHVREAGTGRDVTERIVTESELPDLVGKETADKIVKNEGRQRISEALQGIKDRGKHTGIEEYGGHWLIKFPNNKQLGTYPSRASAEREAAEIDRMVDEPHPAILEGDDLKIGGEGMRGFYDKILPAALNKLAKPFGGKVATTYLDSTGSKLANDSPAHAVAVGAAPAPALDITPEMRGAVLQGQPLFQPAYHGSPHKFEQFSLHHIGKGEGAQSYGWGLYFASQREVADGYRERLAGRPTAPGLYLDGTSLWDREIGLYYVKWRKDGKTWLATSEPQDVDIQRGLLELDPRITMYKPGKVPDIIARTKSDLQKSIENGERTLARGETWSGDAEEDKYRIEQYRHALKVLDTYGDALEYRAAEKPGRTYRVEIPENEDYLDWDKPVSEQSEKVQQALKALGVSVRESGEEAYYALMRAAEEHARTSGAKPPSQTEKAKDASQALAARGIAGIRYLDGLSRAHGEGSSNYVIFDDKLVQVMEYDQGAKGAVEFAADGKSVIRGFAAADVSTGIHEIAHVARRQLLNRNVPAENRHGITDEDIAIAEEWAGAKDGAWSVPAEEKLARGFERYLLEGKAPTDLMSGSDAARLKGIFAKFAAWMRGIYETVEKSPVDVTISEPMRKVFDRLVTRGTIPVTPRKIAQSSTSAPRRASTVTAQSVVVPGLKEFVEQDVSPALKAAAEEFTEAKQGLRVLFAPDTVSRPAQLFAGVMRANLAAHTQRVQRAQRVLAKAEKAFDKLSNDRNLAFMDAIEEGAVDSLPADVRPIAEQLRDLLRTKRNEVRQRGKLQNYIENYFPHEWKQPNKAKQILGQILGRRPLAGPKSFLKKRSIPTVAEGIKLGLEPVSYNPVTLVLHKLAEMDKWIMSRDVLKDAKDVGVAKFVRVGEKPPEGWQRYHESFATVYAPPFVKVEEAFDERLMEKLHEFATALGITAVRKVKIAQKGSGVGGDAWGYAVAPSGPIATKFGGPETVLEHEIGHVLDWKYGLWDKIKKELEEERFDEQERHPARELRDLADKRFEGKTDVKGSFKSYVRKKEEKIANLVHAFIYNPEMTKSVAPNAYWALYNLAKDNPELAPLIELQKTKSLVLGTATADQRVPGLVISGYYYGPPDATRLLNNYLSPGLRGNVAFDLYRRAGNFMNQVQLGLSWFHLTMTGLEAVVSKAAQTLQETSRGVAALSRGDIPVAGRELGHAAKSAAQTPVATFLDLFRGHQALKEFYAQDANARLVGSVADTIIQAGGGIGWDKLHHDDMPKKFMTALRQGNYIGAAWRTVPMAFEAMSKPIMEWWVPRLKIGAFLDLARMELRTLGPEPSVTEVRRVLGDVWDSIDNRFGELRYENLFWHNALKDLGMGSVRALGWNVGTVREVFGAPTRQFKQLRDRPKRVVNTGRNQEGKRTFDEQPEPWLTHKFAYTIAMVFTYGIIGALYQYLHTGERPSTLKDYFFPKTGHRKPDGTEERVSIPGYFKDAYAVLHDFPQSAVTTAGHKMHPFLNAMLEMFQNEDYFGTEIRNQEDSSVQQLKEIFEYLEEQFTPISLRNYDRRRESLSGTGISGWESTFGISEAPASVTRTDAEKLIRRYLPPSTHTRLQAEQMQERQRIREGLKAGTPEGRAQAQAAIQRGTLSQGSVLNTLRTAQASSLQRGFQTLTLDQALKVYEVATEDERAELRTMLERKAQNVENAAPRDREDLMRRLREAGKLPFTRKGQIPVTAR